MVCSASENSFDYMSFVQGHFVHRQVHLNSSCIVVTQKQKTYTHLGEWSYTVTPSNVMAY